MESTGPSVVDKIMLLCVHRQLKKSIGLKMRRDQYWLVVATVHKGNAGSS